MSRRRELKRTLRFAILGITFILTMAMLIYLIIDNIGDRHDRVQQLHPITMTDPEMNVSFKGLLIYILSPVAAPEISLTISEGVVTRVPLHRRERPQTGFYGVIPYDKLRMTGTYPAYLEAAVPDETSALLVNTYIKISYEMVTTSVQTKFKRGKVGPLQFRKRFGPSNALEAYLSVGSDLARAGGS